MLKKVIVKGLECNLISKQSFANIEGINEYCDIVQGIRIKKVKNASHYIATYIF